MTIFLDERSTLDEVLRGRSIARFGDGELRLAIGGKAVSQVAHPVLAAELKRMLIGPTKALVCLPRLTPGLPMPAKQKHIWTRYTTERRYAQYFRQKVYGSTHITRPDSAPWIDTPDWFRWWTKVWAGRPVTLVHLSEKPVRLLSDATRVDVVIGPRRDAFKFIDDIERDVLKLPKENVVLLALGATATVLAERLARQGRQAVDAGHHFMFYRRHLEKQRSDA